MSNIKHKTIEASNTGAGKNFKQPEWIRLQHCFASSDAVTSRLRGEQEERAITLLPLPFFPCDFDSQRWHFCLKIGYSVAIGSRGENLVKGLDPLNVSQSLSETHTHTDTHTGTWGSRCLEEIQIEREKGREQKRKDLHYQWQIKAESLPGLLSFIAIHI